MITYEDARKVMMGVTGKPPDVSWAEVHAVMEGALSAHIKAQVDARPPADPPFARPPKFPNSMSGVSSVDAGVFLSGSFTIYTNYDVMIYNSINGPNQGDYDKYDKAYRAWWTAFVHGGVIAPPPMPFPYRVPMPFSDYFAWWQQQRGQGVISPDNPPISWALPTKLSNFDFEAAVKAKQELVDTQAANQPALGSLLRQQ